MGVLFWFGGLVCLHIFMYSWFFLLFSFVSASSFCVFGCFPSRSRLTATREVVQLPQELFSVTALGRHRFRCATVGALSVPFGTGVRRESSKASGLHPESCFLPRVPASLSWDSRWKVAPCSRVVGDQYRYGFQCRCKVAHFRPFHHFGVSYAGVLTRSGCGCCGMSLSSRLRDASRQEFPQFLNVASSVSIPLY